MDGYRELLAKWVLRELAPESVPDLAVLALERGCDQLEVALLAGLRDPTYGDVDELVEKMLRKCGLVRPSLDGALKVIVDAEASRIVSGAVDAFEGASRIWAAFGFNADGDARPLIWGQIQPFAWACMMRGTSARPRAMTRTSSRLQSRCSSAVGSDCRDRGQESSRSALFR